MKQKILPFLKVIRPLNLLMILATQYLFWWYIVLPNYAIFNGDAALLPFEVILLMACTILIAAGGYVINDYYDLPIDLVNKPDRVIITRSIPDQAAFNYYMALTAAGIIAGVAVAHLEDNYSLAIFPVVMSGLLWFYAQIFKRQFLIGNIIIAICTASVIFILMFYEVDWAANAEVMSPKVNDVLRFGGIYMLFAFGTTLLREVVKDLEDREGDAAFDCHTVPVEWGLAGGKAFALLWTAGLILLTGWVQSAFLRFDNYLAFGYLLAAVQLPLLVIAGLVLKGKSARDFRVISRWVKAVMVLGILSMIYIGIMLGKHG